MAKRILHDFKISAIAAVDSPCQEHAIVTIRKSADELHNSSKAKKLRDLKITELSLVDRPANVDAVVSLAKRREPQQPQRICKAAQENALQAMQRLLDRVEKASASAHTPSLAETLAKACPKRQNATADEAHALAEQYADKNGCSYAQAYDHLAKTQPDLVAKAIHGGH